MSGTFATAQAVGQNGYIDGCMRVFIHFARFRVKDYIGAQTFAQSAIGIEISRITFQILVRVELSWIDKVGNYRTVIFFNGFFDETGMSLMQKTHDRNKPHE